MGSHKKANLRGSGAKQTEGDRLSKDVHGKKGMWNVRREKKAGVSTFQGLSDNNTEDIELNKIELTLLMHLAYSQKYKLPGESLQSLQWHIIDDAEGQSEGITEDTILSIIENINRKMGPWVINIFGTGVYLDPTHREKIMVYIESRKMELG